MCLDEARLSRKSRGPPLPLLLDLPMISLLIRCEGLDDCIHYLSASDELTHGEGKVKIG